MLTELPSPYVPHAATGLLHLPRFLAKCRYVKTHGALPASYANFYIANGLVLTPTYRQANDRRALDILQREFPLHRVVGIDSTELIWGLGSFHCISQQEPA